MRKFKRDEEREEERDKIARIKYKRIERNSFCKKFVLLNVSTILNLFIHSFIHSFTIHPFIRLILYLGENHEIFPSPRAYVGKEGSKFF